MTFQLPLLSKVPFSHRRVLRQLVLNLQPSLSFRFSRNKQREAFRALGRCQTLSDYMAFAHQWLTGGSVQIPYEFEAALDYIRPSAPKHICEIGTDNGGTTFLLSHMFQSAEVIIGVDLYVTNRYRLKRLHRAGQQLRLINGSSHSPRTLRRIRKILGEKRLDLLLIDGDHTYEGVRQDFQMYRELLGDGGFVIFHDIVQDHQTRFGRHTLAYSGGVPLFWQELKPHYDWREFVLDPMQDGMGIGVLSWDPSVEWPILKS